MTNMDFMERLRGRDNIERITGFILYGEDRPQAEETHEERLGRAQEKIEYIIGDDDAAEAYINDAIAEITDIYMEIGIRVGMKLMADAMWGPKKER